MAPGDRSKLAPQCSKLRSFVSKCTVLKKVFVTLLGTFGAPVVIRRPGDFASFSPLVTHLDLLYQVGQAILWYGHILTLVMILDLMTVKYFGWWFADANQEQTTCCESNWRARWSHNQMWLCVSVSRILAAPAICERHNSHLSLSSPKCFWVWFAYRWILCN